MSFYVQKVVTFFLLLASLFLTKTRNVDHLKVVFGRIATPLLITPFLQFMIRGFFMNLCFLHNYRYFNISTK